MLLPTYILLHQELDALATQLPAETASGDDPTEENTSPLERLEERVSLLQEHVHKQDIPYGIIARLTDIKPDSIALLSYAYSDSRQSIIVGVKAASSQDPVNFIEIVEADEMFEEIENFPYDKLGGSEDIEFDLPIQLSTSHGN